MDFSEEVLLKDQLDLIRHSNAGTESFIWCAWLGAASDCFVELGLRNTIECNDMQVRTAAERTKQRLTLTDIVGQVRVGGCL